MGRSPVPALWAANLFSRLVPLSPKRHRCCLNLEEVLFGSRYLGCVLSVNVKSCDAEQEKLFDLINQLHEAMQLGQGRTVVVPAVHVPHGQFLRNPL